MDLTRSIPRSPRETLAGLVMVPRMIDKARAFNAKTLGEYLYPCPLDKIVLDFLNADAEEFARLTGIKSDHEMTLWVESLCAARSQNDKKGLNRKILEHKPDDEESLNKFMEIRNKIDPTRTDVTTWASLLDLDENRLPPKAN
ncbi:hypothetical protein UR09_03560 [Candidatus Nitromaritima sp. SCGC AAA799-A02]|nr:hypothetical protein UZ36_07940 [Candidatus Nitromaritima sp. SCGC AAA799-C22]KMP11340.1 hypothetical protein UR09_03560 [Candidatus Nitromaritima sp. SCGC AAA799-A02]